MDITQFWQLIQQTHVVSNNDTQKQAELLIKELVSLSSEEIIEFERLFDSLVAHADLYNLSDIADFIYGGLGDSGWWDFRAWLVGQGKEFYEQVIANPEILAELVGVDKRNDIVAEELIYVGQKAYREKTGIDYTPSVSPYPLQPISRGVSLWKGVSSSAEYNRLFKEKYPTIWEKFAE